MRERAPKQEQQHTHETHDSSREHLQDALRKKAEHARRDHEKNKDSRVEEATKKAKEHAAEAAKVEDESTKTPDGLHTFSAHQLLKKDAYQQVLKQTQQKLSKPAQLFSKVIHQKTIETVSEVSAKTAGRPSGLLGGGIGAFVGSCVLLYMSKRYGFSYSYTAFIILFCGGFLLGLASEVVYRTVKRR